jgi:hypothetical protein
LSHLCPGTWAVGVPRRRSQRSTSRQGCSWSGSGPEAGLPLDCSNVPDKQSTEKWGEAKGGEYEGRMIRLRTTIYLNVCASLHMIDVYCLHILCVSVPTRLLMAEAHSMRLGNPMISLDSASVCSRGLGRPVYDTTYPHTIPIREGHISEQKREREGLPCDSYLSNGREVGYIFHNISLYIHTIYIHIYVLWSQVGRWCHSSSSMLPRRPFFLSAALTDVRT